MRNSGGCAYPVMVDVEEVERALRQIPTEARRERAPLGEVLGRVAAEDVQSPMNVPPFRRAAMDGFAVRRRNIAAAGPSHPVRLILSGETWAGQRSDEHMPEGSARQVATGAPVPPEADVVVPVEYASPVNDRMIEVRSACEGRSNIAEPGEEVVQGERCVRAGSLLSPQHIGLLASVGINVLSLYVEPLVGLVTTGDELVDLDQSLGSAQVYNSGYYALNGALRRDGARVSGGLTAVPDDADLIKEALIRQRADGVDLILVTGGVSVGARDLIPRTLERLGARLLFWRVRMRPGKAFAAALWQGIPIFALSGNPVAALTCYELFARPYIMRLAGRSRWERPTVEAVLSTPYDKASPERRFLRGVAKWKSSQGWCVDLPSATRTGALSAWIGTNSFVSVPARARPLAAGTTVSVTLDTDAF